MTIPLIDRVKIFIANQIMNFLNSLLLILRKFLFFNFSKNKTFNNILVYKIGNIGDIICAIPSFISIKRAYPKAKITLLSSPGKINMPGAKEILNGVWYFDEIKTYYTEDINSIKKKKDFASGLKEKKYDLFIQIPDELADFKTLFRNMIFAKILGIKYAFGFKIRAIKIFKKAQVDYKEVKTEVESLLEILKANNIDYSKIEYDFNIPVGITEKVGKIFEKWKKDKEIIIAICPGGKKASNQWPVDRLKQVTEYLIQRYDAKLVIVGGKSDLEKANYITRDLDRKEFIMAIGNEILETIEIFKNCDLLISSDTGVIHMAAAVGLPVAVIFNIRSPLNTWTPYGQNHKILYHKFIECDYNNEDCIRKSVEAVSIEEVKDACDQIILKINK